MKTLLAVAAGILLLAVATPGKAADLLLPAKEPPPGQGFTWTGFYIGASAGEAWGSVD